MTSPYDDSSNGDLIIRTSDQTSLHVHKFLIANISSAFADMLPVPQPQSLSVNKPVVDVTESDWVWRRILDLCYLKLHDPNTDERLTIVQISQLLEAGRKYQMRAVTDHARHILLSPAVLEAHPLSVYALGCAYQLEDVARRAARRSLSLPPMPPFVPGFELISVRTLCHLFEYREACSRAASDALNFSQGIPDWMSKNSRRRLVDHDCGTGDCRLPRERVRDVGTYTGKRKMALCPQALLQYLGQLRERLKSKVDPSIASSQDLLIQFIGSVSSPTSCHTCASQVASSILPFSKEAELEVERCISQVRYTMLIRYNTATR